MNSRSFACLLMLAQLLPAAAQAQELPNGKAVYEKNCSACHATGAAGAPRTGDAAAWSRRIGTGIESLYASAIKGKGAMPPKGGNATLTDAQVMAAVKYIVGLASASDAVSPTGRRSEKPVKTATTAVPGAADTTKGKLVYQASCAACHSSGLAGAPKLGDALAWAPRIGAGAGPLYASATKGKGAMPAKGGNASLPDADVRAAVDFMLAQARGGTTSSTPSPPMPATTVAVSVPAAAATRPAPQGSTDPNAFNRLMPAPATRNPPPTEDGIHDPANPGTALLQTPSAAFQSLPRSNVGNYVNWVTALAKKQIPARWDARDTNAAATVMDLNIVREVKGSMPDVVFPHKQHTEWLDCSNCHPAIFTPQKGSNQISMASIMLGQKCGVCHGKVAFPISDCRLCHARQKTAAARAAEAGPAAGGRP